MRKKNIAVWLLPVIVVICVVAILSAHTKCANKQFMRDSGMIFGTTYNITYEASEDLHDAIYAELCKVDTSLSAFNKESVITALNQNKSTQLDDYCAEVFLLAGKVYKDSHGAFDITVAPLVNAWGFGFKNGAMPTDKQVDSLRQIVGFNNVEIAGKEIKKKDMRIMFDCGAIAKGYAVDKVAEMLKSKGVSNFLVEIGGEIVCHGRNAEKKPWRIGVTKPTDDSLAVGGELQTSLSIKDAAMATSGNYRNYYYKDGKKYAHTIDPRTGYPVNHTILSATVVAPTCAEADAYATTFMVVGLDSARVILNRHRQMQAYIIYNNEKGQYSVWTTEGMKRYIKE